MTGFVVQGHISSFVFHRQKKKKRASKWWQSSKYGVKKSGPILKLQNFKGKKIDGI